MVHLLHLNSVILRFALWGHEAVGAHSGKQKLGAEVRVSGENLNWGLSGELVVLLSWGEMVTVVGVVGMTGGDLEHLVVDILLCIFVWVRQECWGREERTKRENRLALQYRRLMPGAVWDSCSISFMKYGMLLLTFGVAEGDGDASADTLHTKLKTKLRSRLSRQSVFTAHTLLFTL